MWSNWDEFLEEIADVHGLDQEEREAFLAILAEKGKIKSMRQLSAKLNISESAVKIRMGKVYEKFARICPGIDGDSRGKAKTLQLWLNQQYSAQSKIKATEATYSIAIAPPDWQKVCCNMLEAQKQSIRRQATEIVSEPFFVQLGLVERRHQPRRDRDFSISPEQGSGFFQPTREEIIETYEHDEFLEQVIKQGQSKKSQGKRIAIIGEPGAGKTTLLEAISLTACFANAFSPKTPGFPIWISLGSLGDKSLEQYLREKWLKDALPFISPEAIDVTPELEKELAKLFNSGEVLLLLDGVDEMPAPSPVQALAKIREELTGWIAKARVVLTCRVNVWDANLNSLQGFDTYRTLEFSYGDGNKPDQVREFICEWFSKTDKPELGEPLRKKLEEDRHQRIRDLVKNPLRLSLLCQSWYRDQGDLPKTKAELYEQFTEAFYEWKKEPHSTTLTERNKLNEALGLLAKEAIDKEKSRFGIRRDFALKVMGEDLFKLATEKLNWLVEVYKETGKPVYAFFHPTFQEYFAACAIPNWDYFLKHVPHNPTQGTYRIFESQWKEVILIWLGRTDILPEQKENFIYALVNFKDGVSPFYWFQAFFLSAASIAEFQNFKDCNFSDAIVSSLVYWGFGYFDSNTHGWFMPVNSNISEKARAVLQETDHSKVIEKLTQLLSNHMNTLNELITLYQDEEIPRLVLLGYDGALLNFVIIVALSLLKLESGNLYAVRTLTELEETFYYMDMTIYGLMSMAEDFKQLIDISKSYLPSSQRAGQVSDRSSEHTYNPSIEEILNGRIEIDAVNDLIKEVSNSQEQSKSLEALFKIKKIIRGKLFILVVKELKYFIQHLVPNQQNWLLQIYCIEIMQYCAQNMTYPEFYQAWHGDPSSIPALEN